MQEILRGRDTCRQLTRILSTSKKFMIVCGSALHFPSLEEQLQSFSTPYVRYSGFSPNPQYDDVYAGVQLFRRESCDAIVAVGGGSAIDVAKCIKLYCRMDPNQNYLQQPYLDSGVPLIAIPSTAGSGSESTHFAVIYEQGRKQSVTHESLLPNTVILDADGLKTLPLYQKKSTALDALCHSIESWWSIRSTSESRALSKEAIENLLPNLGAYLAGNPIAAEKMLYAANLAGQAIDLTTTTAAHAMSYGLTNRYQIPHGHAVAICLPYVWAYLAAHPEKCVDTRGAAAFQQTLSEIETVLGGQNGPGSLSALLKKLGIQEPETEREEDLDELAAIVNPERLGNSPVTLDAGALRTLYGQIVRVKGKSEDET